jgi:hypothetical protein
VSNMRKLHCGKHRHLLILLPLLLGLRLGICPAQVRADENGNDKTWSNVSKALVPFLVAGEVSLLASGDGGTRKATRAAEALLITGALTEGLKRVTHQKRPDNDERDSFPSNHASLSFAMAASLATYQPKYKWLGYGVASAISYSRVRVNRHRWHEVIGGAALGYFVARRVTRGHHDGRDNEHGERASSATNAPMLEPSGNDAVSSLAPDNGERDEPHQGLVFTGSGLAFQKVW